MRIVDKFQHFLYNLRGEGLSAGDMIEIYLPQRLYDFLRFELSTIQRNPQEATGGFDQGIVLFEAFRIKPMQEIESMRHALQDMTALKSRNISLMTQLASSEDD